MAPFGKYLSKQGTVSRPALEEATQAMVVFGGRLGTHLVESGALTLEQLENHLAQYLSVSTPPPEALARPDPNALAILSRYRVTELKILPFRLEDRTLHVAMRDPRDGALVSALAQETGLRVRPYLLSEVRLFFLLQQHFGVDAAERYERKPETAPREPAKKRATPPPPPNEDRERKRRELGIAGLGAGEEFVDEQTFASMLWSPLESPQLEDPNPSPAPALDPIAAAPMPAAALAPTSTPTPSAAAPKPPIPTPEPSAAAPKPATSMRAPIAAAPKPPTSTRAPNAAPARPTTPVEAPPPQRPVHELMAELERADDRSQVVRHALEIARHHAPTAALFAVRNGLAQLLHSSSAFDGERTEAPAVPIDAAALASRAPSPTDPSSKLGKVLGRKAVRDAAVHRVMLAGRVVNLLYVDNGPEHLDADSGPALRELCERVAKAYERIILSRKKTLL